ncbi:MAG: LysR substrate-binding domain-containing protein [Oceanospirillaceae bacterium]
MKNLDMLTLNCREMSTMQNFKQQLPPLNSLVTFEAAARHLSFTLAAKELNVTQAAVSRQVKILEEALDQPLFIRYNRRLSLTPSAIIFLPDVRYALQFLANSAAALKLQKPATKQQSNNQNCVSIASTQAFATLKLNHWLLQFNREYPNIRVKLITSDTDINMPQQTTDLEISCGDAIDNSVLKSTFLFADEIFPICSPAYLAAHPKLNNSADLLNHQLLHLDAEHWRNLSWQAIDWHVWFTSQNIDTTAKLKGLRMNSYPLLLQAVLNGNGVALGWQHLVSDLLKTEELIKPIDVSYKSQRAYYLIETKQAQSAPVTHLSQWILQRAATDKNAC